MEPSQDPSWSYYPETVLEFETTPALAVDLRRQIPPADLPRLRALADNRSFAVLTPCNPRGQTLSDQDNESRLAGLIAELGRLAIPAIGVTGVSPDRKHREPGVAVAVAQLEAVELAARLEQSALFWFDGEAVWLVPVLIAGQPCRLPFA
ncbi:MAG: DUF3293 domain-containing protein [Gemmatimonadota bacterium]